MHGKDFFKRKIAVDFAVSKNRYQSNKKETDDEIKEEEPEIKEEVEIKEDPEVKSESEKEESSDESESDESDDDEDEKSLADEPTVPVKKENKYTEADNAFTVFVKNLSFDSTNEDLEKCFKKFGPIKYALVVKDHVSGHSKGTGFIRFLKKESVEICLAQSGKIILQDFPIEVLPTLSKKTVSNIAVQKEKNKHEPKDGRNLYLLREGMILAGSDAANGVSATDMAKRLRLEQIKSQMLKNLTRFIARDRLTIHNIPENYDDDKLRKVVLAKTSYKPLECRVMRENKPSPSHPRGQSKGFGFLSFKRHDDALNVLRKLNNNPEVFSTGNRPIVSFSIEDMNVLKIKEKRQARSLANNPTYQKKMEKLKIKKQAKKKDKKDNKTIVAIPSSNKNKSKEVHHEPEDSFSGFASKPGGASVKLRGTFKLNQQSRIHEKTMKERNKKVRKDKHDAEIRQEKLEKKHDRPVNKKRKFNNNNDSLTDKIEKYRSMMRGMDEVANKKRKTSKWSIN